MINILIIMHPKETKENKRDGRVRTHYYLSPASLSNLIDACGSHIELLVISWNKCFLTFSGFWSEYSFSHFFLHAIIVDRMAPKVIQVLIPGTYEYATLYNKNIFAGIIKVKDFKIGKIILDYPVGPI